MFYLGNELITAVFLVGDYDTIQAVNTNDLITKEQAISGAISEMENIYGDAIEIVNDKYTANLKTFNGCIYWSLCFNASIVDTDGNSEINYFEIRVDAENASVLEIATGV